MNAIHSYIIELIQFLKNFISHIDNNTFLLAFMSLITCILAKLFKDFSNKWWRPEVKSYGREYDNLASTLLCPLIALLTNFLAIICTAILGILFAIVPASPQCDNYQIVYFILSIILSTLNAIIFLERSKNITYKYRIPYILIELAILNTIYFKNDTINNTLLLLYTLTACYAMYKWVNRKEKYLYSFADITLANDTRISGIPINKIEKRGTWFILHYLDSEETRIPEDKVIRIDYFGKPVEKCKK